MHRPAADRRRGRRRPAARSGTSSPAVEHDRQRRRSRPPAPPRSTAPPPPGTPPARAARPSTSRCVGRITSPGSLNDTTWLSVRAAPVAPRRRAPRRGTSPTVSNRWCPSATYTGSGARHRREVPRLARRSTTQTVCSEPIAVHRAHGAARRHLAQRPRQRRPALSGASRKTGLRLAPVACISRRRSSFASACVRSWGRTRPCEKGSAATARNTPVRSRARAVGEPCPRCAARTPTARRRGRARPRRRHSREQRAPPPRTGPPRSAASRQVHVDDVVRVARHQLRALRRGDHVVGRRQAAGEGLRVGVALAAKGGEQADVAHVGSLPCVRRDECVEDPLHVEQRQAGRPPPRRPRRRR